MAMRLRRRRRRYEQSIPLGDTTDEVWRQMRPHLIQVGWVRKTATGLQFMEDMGTYVDAMPVYVRKGTPWRTHQQEGRGL